LFQGKLEQKVKLKLSFRGKPVALATKDGLTQILSHLVHNALQAMEYSGTLELAKAFGGEISLTSRPGATAFRLILPRAPR
jgi:signal transduction histidine kinase